MREEVGKVESSIRTKGEFNSEGWVRILKKGGEEAGGREGESPIHRQPFSRG